LTFYRNGRAPRPGVTAGDGPQMPAAFTPASELPAAAQCSGCQRQQQISKLRLAGVPHPACCDPHQPGPRVAPRSV